jgi:hypothetical protein
MLTWLSFTIWLVLTSLLFIVLARWSAGEGSWGGMSGIVRGLHDWAAPQEPAPAVSSPASVATAEPVAEIEEL